jgi:hypothetical protein
MKKMKKVLLVCVAVVLLVALAAVPVFAKGPDGLSGSSSTGHVYLYEKDSGWNVVDGGAWGKFSYSLSGTGATTSVSGVFNGKGLQPGVCYALINYKEPAPNPWPAGGVSVVCLGTGVANGGGNVNIDASGTIGGPDNMPLPDTRTGDKIWLVPCDDLDDDMDMIEAWNPSSILFENDLINTP